MHPSFVPPRRVGIGDAASFTGIAPRDIRHYDEIGLLPGPEYDDDGERRYGYDHIVRLLWIDRMIDAGVASEDVRDALAATAAADDGNAHHLATKTRLLSDLVAGRLEDLPAGSLRHADVDSLLITERILGPVGAAVHASRFIALAIHPGLRDESDRVEAAEAALDDTVAVDHPLVAQVAAQRHAFERRLRGAIEHSGLAASDDALLGSGAAGRSLPANETVGTFAPRKRRRMSALEAIAKLPYDYSPARLRCMQLAADMEKPHDP